MGSVRSLGPSRSTCLALAVLVVACSRAAFDSDAGKPGSSDGAAGSDRAGGGAGGAGTGGDASGGAGLAGSAACAPTGVAGARPSDEPAAPTPDPVLAGEAHHAFKISVLDATTRFPVVGARLQTTNKISYTADKNGVVAFYEPGLMGTDVYFAASRAGYDVPADVFGYHGKALRPVEGGAGEILMTQVQTAAAPAAGDLQTRLLAQPVPGAADCLALRAVDKAGRRGVPLVFLTTPDEVYVTDSQGFVAYCNPDHLGTRVTFAVASPGYRFAAGSVAVDVTRGTSVVVELERVNVAERLYRVTGQGIYRDSVLLGLTTPLARPVIDGLVMGQDTVDATRYRGQLFWIWGDTDRAAYPLGNFRTSGALSELPAPGGAGLAGSFGVDTTYFTGTDGFSRGMIEDIAPSSNPTWIGSLLALLDAQGAERLFAVYTKPDSNLAALKAGLVRFDDQQHLFLRAGVEFPLTDFVAPGGQPSVVRQVGGAYVYYGTPLRVPATAEALADTGTYETWSALGAMGGKTLERAADGSAAYAWKRGALETTPALVKAAGLPPSQALGGHVTDAVTGTVIETAGLGGESWNEHRRRFVKVIQQLGGATSTLGELWALEADTPLGPWVYARKVVTHDDYTFYNPWLHPYLAQDGDRVVYFEATYTKSFAGTKTPVTPRYDYNQIMYRLDLDDERLVLPAPVYDVGAQAGTELAGKAELHVAAPALAPVFFAPDRAAPGTVPLSWSGPACAPRALVAGATPGLAPAFFAVSPTATPRPAGVVPLYDYAHADGRHAYAVVAAAAWPGFSRAPAPIAYVWPSPVAVKLPVADFLGELVADAGDDQCLVETAAGAGALVSLDGSRTRAVTAAGMSWTWRELDGACAIGSSPQVDLQHVSAGVHTFVLTVADTAGRAATDTVVVRVAAP